MALQGSPLPLYVMREFDDYLNCGRLERGFLRVRCESCRAEKLERICRYVARPAVSEKRLALTKDGRVGYELPPPYNDGTTHVIFELLDFIARLTALVPKPRVNLTPMEQHAAMTWARPLKRVFAIDITECEQCKSPVKIIACIEDPVVNEKILDHLRAKGGEQDSQPSLLSPGRAPPQLPAWDQGLID